MNDLQQPDLLFEVDDNLYSLTALLQAQIQMGSRKYDERNLAAEAANDSLDHIIPTIEEILTSEESDSLSNVRRRNLLNTLVAGSLYFMRSNISDIYNEQAKTMAAESLQAMEEEIERGLESLCSQIADDLRNEALAKLSDLNKGLAATATLRHIAAGNASIPRGSGLYNRRIKVRIKNHIAAIRSIVPADFPND